MAIVYRKTNNVLKLLVEFLALISKTLWMKDQVLDPNHLIHLNKVECQHQIKEGMGIVHLTRQACLA